MKILFLDLCSPPPPHRLLPARLRRISALRQSGTLIPALCSANQSQINVVCFREEVRDYKENEHFVPEK
ncbi:hypothetical protein DAPPUDRAFT_241017 [Daphnia pulex]|uniref:Uncharacterized protein n=1 Tax=Daphnia pulex TaxID=6669 RepID=E9GD73_DAPPU|nr:hypothetical protein DAPPUDRAFT_241017 [Daphnia pulex]|eukprot:EFX82744.1 hypothetical protein DAPPUDRAFT_241017 [Daphnia pulex]